MHRESVLGSFFITACVLASPWAAAAPAHEPAAPVPFAPITSLAELRALPPEQAAEGRPVHLSATVTYYHHEWEMVFVQDDTGAAFVYVDHHLPPVAMGPGQRVEIVGRTQAGDFLPSITDAQFKPLRMVGLPAPRQTTLQAITRAENDAFWIEVTGIVRSATVVDDLLDLIVQMEGGTIKVYVKEWRDMPHYASLVDDVVKVRGVCTTLTNEHRRFMGAEIWTPGLEHVTVVEAAPADPFAVPGHSLDSLRRFAFAGGQQRRLKVAGTVTLAQPGRGMFIQDESDGVFVQTPQSLDLQPGDRVEALGFVSAGGRHVLEDATVRRLGPGGAPPPAAITAEHALSGNQDSRLVRIKGRFVGRIVSAGESAFVLQDGEVAFNVRVPQDLPPETEAVLQPGSLVEVVGVCSVPSVDAGTPRTFQVGARSAADIQVRERPSWWTAARVRWLLCAFFGTLVAALAWAAVLRRRVRQQTAIIRERLEREAAFEQRYRDLVENANDVVFSLDADGRFTSLNAAAERVLGYPRQEILGRSLIDVTSGPHKGRAGGLSRAAPDDSAQRCELDIVTSDGRHVILEVNARGRVEGGRRAGVDAIARDITERSRVEEELRRKEEALRESQQRFALAVRGTNDGVWDWDLRADRVYYSPRWKSMLGYGEEEVGDSPAEWFRLVHPDELERLTARLTQHRDGLTPHFEHEHRMLHKDGTYRWVLSRGFALRGDDGEAYRMAGAQTDVTDRRAYDVLTGLPNKALFVERLEKAVSRSRGAGGHLFAVLFLDLDRFKLVNDSLGHLTGDTLLVTFGQRLEGCVRPGDMIARFGGDEFAILVDDIEDASDAARVAERIQSALTAPFNLGGPEIYMSGSIGIALSTSGYDRAEDLLRDADTAMYRAKAGGRARYEVFDAAMRQHVTAFMRTQNDLRRALEREELRVQYQPIVELTTGAVVAMEALVRWQHPERGLLPPSEFVAVAEETGLIVPIGDWVLHRACREARTWRDRFPDGPFVSMCVNLSARQVSDPDLLVRVRAALDESQLAAGSLVLEITESAILETADGAVAKIAGLKELGVRLHLDDFGTGYSSLSYLHRFPIDALKIDRSFVATMMENDDARAIVRSILNLAESLRLSVIAEGVETEAQAGLLRGLGCAQAQGYHFSAALEPRMAVALMASASRGSATLGRRNGIA
jgi:diguanylate cyclase (GGDEF)-like protein/PAS domain S-box-containing protein